MIQILKKTIRIIDVEIFNKFLYRLFINAIVLALLIALQFNDITLKESSNYLLVIWIAVNNFFIIKSFMKEGTNFIFATSKLDEDKKFIIMFASCFIINVQWLIFLVVTLKVFWKACWISTILIAIEQFVFAMSLGMFAGVLHKKNLGMLLLAVLGIYNFIFCNPYNCNSANYMFFISDVCFTVNDINVITIISQLLLSFLFTGITYVKLQMSVKYTWKKVLFQVLTFIVAMSLLTGYCVRTYHNLKQSKHEVFYLEGDVEYRGITETKAREIASIVRAFESKFNELQLEHQYRDSVIRIEKEFLPACVWGGKKDRPEPILISKDVIYINLLSRNMLYYENPDLLRSFMEDINLKMEIEQKNFRDTKYTRHILDGYSIHMLWDVARELTFGSSADVQQYYEEYVEDWYRVPANEYNFVKKISYLVYEKHQSERMEFYNLIVSKKPKNDKEFIVLLKQDFSEIYYDQEIKKIIDTVGLGDER